MVNQRQFNVSKHNGVVVGQEAQIEEQQEQ
jgi:hypothetical protein